MITMKKAWVIFIAFGCLGLINFTIWQHEDTLATGETILLELAPVDPRSLMQGDYMALRFAIAEQIQWRLRQTDDQERLTPTTRFATVELDAQHIATLVSEHALSPLANNQRHLQYRERDGYIQFATNAFFFQEGTAEDYEQAVYGLFKVTPKGTLLLAKMLDKDLKPLGRNRLLETQ